MHRCDWAKSDLAIAYHDEEWGCAASRRTRFYLSFLILEGAQAGLSWENHSPRNATITAQLLTISTLSMFRNTTRAKSKKLLAKRRHHPKQIKGRGRNQKRTVVYRRPKRVRQF